jgi:hypothetical protein
MVRIYPAAIAACFVVALPLSGGCSAAPAASSNDAGYSSTPTRHDSCAGLGFRQPTPGAVVCPGTQNCECGGTDICCMQAVDSNSGVCQSLGACRYLALTCTGPEACNTSTAYDVFDGGGGTESGAADAGSVADSGSPAPDAGMATVVCCLDEAVGVGGGGSTCRPAGKCNGKVLCRTDDDCRMLPSFPHCRPADYGTPGVEDRGLDGLVGECQR